MNRKQGLMLIRPIRLMYAHGCTLRCHGDSPLSATIRDSLLIRIIALNLMLLNPFHPGNAFPIQPTDG